MTESRGFTRDRVERELRIAEDVAEEGVRLFLAARPTTVVLAGGSTPRPLYERLARVPYRWRETELFFGDERCVPRGHPDSNLRMADEALLSRIDSRVYPIDGGACDADAYDRLLRERFASAPAFDLALYGLGSDGHTASLFPGRPELEVGERLAVRVPSPGQPPFVARVTMTLPALSSARLGIFLVSGGEKSLVLARLMANDDIPAARVAPDRLLVLADRAAAETLLH